MCQGRACLDDCAVEHEALDAATRALTEGTLRRNANLLDPWLPGCGFEIGDELSETCRLNSSAGINRPGSNVMNRNP